MLRALSALFLSLILSMTSVTMAVARAQAPVAGEITICSGYGIVTISVDAEGNPTGPVHPCPDCLAGLVLAPAPDAPAVQRPDLRSVRHVPLPVVIPVGLWVPNAKSRGPPLSI